MFEFAPSVFECLRARPSGCLLGEGKDNVVRLTLSMMFVYIGACRYEARTCVCNRVGGFISV